MFSNARRLSSDCCVQADIIVANPATVIDRGELLIRNGLVKEVRAGWNDGDAIRLEGRAVVPGLINCHTHLEFSYLHEPFPATDGFPAWIGKVVGARRQIESEMSTEDFLAFRDASIRSGLQELHACGTALAVDIVTMPWDSKIASDSDEDSTAIIPLCEVIGLDQERLTTSFDWAMATINSLQNARELSCGLSPHAPYSLMFPDAAERFCILAEQPIAAMHLAESWEEMQWLNQRKGPFKDALERIGVALPKYLPSVDECIEMLGKCERGLVVHGNYLTLEQLQGLAGTPNMSLVTCPRTHEHFGHSEFPIAEAIAAGVRVVLGTDSRASNPDLSLWFEMSCLRQKVPSLAPEEVFAMATTRAVEAIGGPAGFGEINASTDVASLWTLECEGRSRAEFLDFVTTLNEQPKCEALPRAVELAVGKPRTR
jgi:cytosine/adenosine deaminase-related metal-dependent hydrolase